MTFVDRENITVAPDTHVIQASERLGIISSEEAGQGSNVQEIVAQRWQEILNDKEVRLRSVRLDEAQMLIDYLKTVTGETRFLMCEPNEIEYTRSQEEQFIKSHNESKDALLILAFVDGNMQETVRLKAGLEVEE